MSFNTLKHFIKLRRGCISKWSDCKTEIKIKKNPIISANSRIFTIGSCFAIELAMAIASLNLIGSVHGAAPFFHTKSIRQEFEKCFGAQDRELEESYWKLRNGYINPFRRCFAKDPFPTKEELRIWSNEIDLQFKKSVNSADVIVITLGLIEVWRQPKTGNYYREMPLPQVFNNLKVEFHRLTVSEMKDDLTHICRLISEHSNAKIILTVSPIPLWSTFVAYDVRVANCESKSRIRAAVSEFIENNDNIYYFQSYEIVTSAEKKSDFMRIDGRHIHQYARQYIIKQFLETFADETVNIPEVDTGWLTQPEKVAKTPHMSDSYPAAKINALIEHWKKCKSNIVIYGAGEHTQQMFHCSNIINTQVVGIVDQDQNKQGKQIFGFKILSPECIPKLKPNVILISSLAFQNEIYTHLKKFTDNNIEIVPIYEK